MTMSANQDEKGIVMADLNEMRQANEPRISLQCSKAIFLSLKSLERITSTSALCIYSKNEKGAHKLVSGEKKDFSPCAFMQRRNKLA